MWPAGTNLVFNVQDRQVFNVSRWPPTDFQWECARGVCQDMKNCSMYAGVQCTQVFNLTGSTALAVYGYVRVMQWVTLLAQPALGTFQHKQGNYFQQF